MDVTSYLLGKNASGGGGTPSGGDKIKPLTLTFNANSGDVINTQMIDTSLLTTFRNMFVNTTVEELDLSSWNTSKVTNMQNMFGSCKKLKTVKIGTAFDTSSVTTMDSMFNNCLVLENIPAFNASKVTNFGGMFSNVGPNLTDESLDNILLTCISAVSYTGTKTLNKLSFPSGWYPASRIQALPHYQDFINAGWTIGY